MTAGSVAIIGAGPVGLAAGTHALERGLSVVILEQGDEVGHAIREWKHVKMLSPWEFNVDAACERVDQYGDPLGNDTVLTDDIKLGSKATAISRAGYSL